METLKHPADTKANKEHVCNFCCEKIKQGTVYLKSTHVYYGELYDWKTHKHCAKIASHLNMYDDCDEGVTTDHFRESIDWTYVDVMFAQFDKEDREKYSHQIAQFRFASFRHKLNYLCRHYKLFNNPSTDTN